MIQFNLLPDVKQQFIKAKRQKHSVIVISILVAAASLFIFVMLFLTVNVFQKAQLNGLNNAIKKDVSTLKGTEDLNKVLTIQNQLDSLPDLHNQKPVTSRLFAYLTQLTPSKVGINSVQLDYSAKNLTLVGSADSISTINKFVDTLKFTTYTAADSTQTGGASTTGKPFSQVVLTSFSKSPESSTYQVSLNFDSIIFDSQKNVTLKTPKIISTRSETEKPTELFQELPKVKK